MERISVKSRFAGTLLGVAVGDALGQPIEFLNMKEVDDSRNNSDYDKKIRKFKKMVREKYGGIVTEMLPNPFGYWEKGEHTDDTAQTLLLADSLIERGYDPGDFAARLVTWFDGGKAKGLGKTTTVSIELLEKGESWKNSGKLAIEKGGVPSNGSLMRTSPLGLYLRSFQDGIDNSAEEISSITHASEESIKACQIATRLVAHLSNGMPKLEAIDSLKQNYINEIEQVNKVNQRQQRYDGGAYETLNIALTSFANANNFEEAVVTAVNAGGDSDTQGSICGAFAGAHWGLAQIPERWALEIKPTHPAIILEKSANLFFQTQN